MDNYSDDLLTLLENQSVEGNISIVDTSCSKEKTGKRHNSSNSFSSDVSGNLQTDNMKTGPFVSDHDHDYSRRSPFEDSGFSSENPVSSPGSGSEATVETASSPFSSASSPSHLSDDQIEQQIPLGMDIEDLKMTDFRFDTLDPSAFLPDDDFLSSVVDPNFTLNLEGMLSPRAMFFCFDLYLIPVFFLFVHYQYTYTECCFSSLFLR